MSRVQIALKDRFCIASDDNWVFEGEVTAITDEHIEVDFYDWVQRYPIKAIREGWDCVCDRYLGPGIEPGVTIRDHRRERAKVK